MATPENLSKQAVRRAIAVIEAQTGKNIPVMMPIPDGGNAGAPDFWIMVWSRLVLVETKADPAEGGKDATELQNRFMEEWSDAGAITFTVRDAADYYERERANAQQLSRLLLNPTADGRNGRLPADLEEACVLCLPGIYRAACLRELAARYGLMAAPEAPRGSGEECLRAADLLRETAEAVRALPTVLEGDDAPDASALERAEAELADVAAVVASLRASVQRRRHNVVQLRSAR